MAAGRIMNLIISRRSKQHWLPTYLKPINTHPTLGEGQNGKLYGSRPDPFSPPRNKGKGSATRDYISQSVSLSLFYFGEGAVFQGSNLHQYILGDDLSPLNVALF